MLFSETLASMQPREGGWRAVIGEDWSQGRATFGGMVAALGNEAMRRLVPADRELRGLETTFVGPALCGEVGMDAEILRVGKAVSIARARVWSDGKIAAALTGIYGAAPFAGSSLRTAKIYVRHQDPAPLSESHVVALIDSIPSVVLQLMSTPAPSSSLTWTVQFLRHDYSFAPEAWWRIDAEVNSAGSGYSCESCVLLDPNGAPAAVARQMVAVFG
jgi:acyl-CoA thioesterase